MCLQKVKDKLEKDNDIPEKIDIPSDASEEIKSSYKNLIFICEKCKKALRYKSRGEGEKGLSASLPVYT